MVLEYLGKTKLVTMKGCLLAALLVVGAHLPYDAEAARAAVLVCCEKDFEKFLFGFHLLKIVRVGERKQTWTASKLAYYVAVSRADQL